MILAALVLAAGVQAAPPSSVRGEPVEAHAPNATPATRPSTSSGRTVEGVDQVAHRYAVAGEILVAKGDKVLLDKGYGPVAPNGKALHKAGQRWRLASITKQVTAALIVGLGNEERLDTSYFDGLTIRQLLTHHTGLANPDTTPPASGVPSFYSNAEPDVRYCLSLPAKPGSAFAYNNCDYVVVDMLARSGSPDAPSPLASTWPTGMSMAQDDEMGVPGFVGGKAEPTYRLASFGAAGGLIGTARSVFAFDRALMTGKLLTAVQRDALWTPEGNGSYQALGQWVFPGQLKGCAAPKRIVQRDGEIGGVQTRNFILPEDDLVVIVFTNRSSDDFKFGEIWQQSGFAYDLLSAVACS